MQISDSEPQPCSEQRVALKLLVSEELFRAFQRCLWVRMNESGRTQLELMEEVVLDFLKKHDC